MINDVKIDPNQCIGCGGCERSCSAVFRLSYKVHAKVSGKNFARHAKKVLAAYHGCPVQAIELDSEDDSLLAQWYAVRLTEKRMLSETVMEVVLKGELQEPFVPGQYVTVRFTDDIGHFNRAYSVVSYGNGTLVLCVTLVKGGRGSSFFAHYAEGSELEISAPKGDFVIQDTQNPKVFVGTGAGLAPLIAMAESCPAVKKTLFFGQRNERELFYRERLEKVPNLEVMYCLDFADDDWAGPRGRVTEHFQNFPLTRDTEVYTCGSNAMMNDLGRRLKKKHHPRNKFFKESFLAQSVDVSESALLWRWWIRAIHINLSMILCVLFLFFGFTGFVANRPELFHAESQKTVPANIAMVQGELGGFFKTQFGEGFEVANFQQADGRATLDLENPEKIRCAVELDEESRIYTVTETRPLPKGSLSLPEDVLAQNLAKTLRGKLDEGSVEKDENTIYFNMESVWVKCAVMVDLDRQEYQINRESVPWVKAFVLLHKGKQAGMWQRILIDIAGIGMVIVALSGMIMAFQASATRTRMIAFALTGGSILIALLMTAGR